MNFDDKQNKTSLNLDIVKSEQNEEESLQQREKGEGERFGGRSGASCKVQHKHVIKKNQWLCTEIVRVGIRGGATCKEMSDAAFLFCTKLRG